DRGGHGTDALAWRSLGRAWAPASCTGPDGFEETRLTTTKKKGDAGSEPLRPRMKSSHERVLDAAPPKRKTKATREAPRASAPDRARPLRKARPEARRGGGEGPVQGARGHVRSSALEGSVQGGQRHDASASWSVAAESARQTATAVAIAALDKKAAGLE